MKPLLLIPALFLAACASRTQRAVIVTPTAPPSRPAAATAFRAAEQVCEYRFGRYVDPGDPLTLHEGHPVYRVETSAGWNLRSGSTATTSPPRIRAEAPSVSTNDAVVAEVNKQRAATRAFTAQTATLNERLAAMQQAVAKVDELAKQNLALKHELGELRKREDASAAQPDERKATVSGQPPAEDKW